MRRPIMAGNWKMYKTPAETAAFFEKFLPLVQGSTRSRYRDLSPVRRSSGRGSTPRREPRLRSARKTCIGPPKAPTPAKFRPAMLRAAGCQWVIIAHSERREYFGETEETAFKKICAALKAGLTPIYCVGEQLDDREGGNTHEVLARQFRGCAGRLDQEQFQGIVIAYEPVLGHRHRQSRHARNGRRRARLHPRTNRRNVRNPAAEACRILYGGSVKPDNIGGLMAQDEIDGALVGGASLDPISFAAIVNF